MSIALADLVDPKQITLNLRAETQEEAMREIVGLLVAADRIDNPQKFVEQLRARETTNSTYAADGVAFPHVDEHQPQETADEGVASSDDDEGEEHTASV